MLKIASTQPQGGADLRTGRESGLGSRKCIIEGRNGWKRFEGVS